MRPNRFLQLLKLKGPLTARTIAGELGMTGEGARLQLQKLTLQGLVTAVSQTNGVGRPQQVYELTEQGNASFPDGHADLTAHLLNSVRENLGDQALNVILKARENDNIKRYSRLLENCKDTENLLLKYAAIRSDEGYMAELKKEGDQYLLIENHCPISAAASSCMGLCESDLRVITLLLGPSVAIERSHHMITGERRCVYIIKPLAIR